MKAQYVAVNGIRKVSCVVSITAGFLHYSDTTDIYTQTYFTKTVDCVEYIIHGMFFSIADFFCHILDFWYMFPLLKKGYIPYQQLLTFQYGNKGLIRSERSLDGTSCYC